VAIYFGIEIGELNNLTSLNLNLGYYKSKLNIFKLIFVLKNFLKRVSELIDEADLSSG
jgi:hypothetical protein